MVCNYNCLECPYPDCINDEITAEEEKLSKKLDGEINAENMTVFKNKQQEHYIKNRNHYLKKNLEYHYEHRDDILKKKHDKYEANKEYCQQDARERRRKAYAENPKKIQQQNKAYRERKKLKKLKEQQLAG